MAKKSGNQKTYRNEGVTQLVFEDQEIDPGTEFRATLEPTHEMQLLAGGHISIVQDQSVAADREQATEAGEVEPTKKSRR